MFEGEDAAAAPATEAVPDARVRLMFVCAHPALPENVRAPLMLQAVLGLEAQAIDSAFLVSPAAMAQRLVRAKARIRETGLRFDPPEAAELPARLAAVLDAIYGAYTLARRDQPSDLLAHDLREEAVFLARPVTCSSANSRADTSTGARCKLAGPVPLSSLEPSRPCLGRRKASLQPTLLGVKHAVQAGALGC